MHFDWEHDCPSWDNDGGDDDDNEDDLDDDDNENDYADDDCDRILFTGWI